MDSILDRTVCIGPIKPHTFTKINDYFEGFGTVESCRILVQFETVKDAKKALEQSPNSIEECFIMDARSYFDNPSVPHFESKSNILNALNEHCLRLVFKHLNKSDLINAADVCLRFEQCAKEAFAAMHKEKSIEITANSDIEQKNASAMLRKFGESIEKLVIKNCTFKLSNPFEPNDYIAAAFKSLSNLKVLHIISSAWESPLLIQRFAKLEELRLQQNPSTFDKKHYNENMELCNFLRTNQNLKKLAIIENEIDFHFEMFELIGQYHPNLVELQIDQSLHPNDIPLDNYQFQIFRQSIINSKLLKSLTFDFYEMQDFTAPSSMIDDLVAGNVPIEELRIHFGDAEDLIGAISRLNQIKVLGLRNVDYLHEDELFEMIRGLPQLQKLSLYRSLTNGRHFNEVDLSVKTLTKIVAHSTKLSKLTWHSFGDLVIDADDYESLLKLVKNRPEKVRLDIHILSYYENAPAVLNVANETLYKNRDCLYIHIR